MHSFRKKISILLALGLLAAFCGCTVRHTPVAPEVINQSSMTPTTEADQYPALPPAETKAPELPEPEPTEPAVSSAPSPEEEVEMPRAERVTDDYFSDAAFFGNSLVDGLRLYSDLKCDNFFAGTSASVLSVETICNAQLRNGKSATLLDALLERQYANIYVLFGINELGFQTETFVEMYATLLDKVAAAEPEAKIFVMSLTPITQKRSEGPDVFTREKVEAFNVAIRAMAAEHGYTYLDLYTALADEDGWLTPEQSVDGVHFTTAKYLQWAEYMRINYDGLAPEPIFPPEPEELPEAEEVSDLPEDLISEETSDTELTEN